MSKPSGTIYMLRCEGHERYLVKIGKTTRSVDERARELSSATGVPSSFEVLFEMQVDDVDAAEQKIHRRLEVARWNEKREFFLLPQANAEEVITDVCSEINDGPLNHPGRVVIWVADRAQGLALGHVLQSHAGVVTAVARVIRRGQEFMKMPGVHRVRWNARLIRELREIAPDVAITVMDSMPGPGFDYLDQLPRPKSRS